MMKLMSLSVYETSSYFTIIGTDKGRINYYVLKLDRSNKESFDIDESTQKYTKNGVEELLATTSSSSVVSDKKSGKTTKNTLLQTIPRAYGIVGAIRFLEGYYLIVVTKAKIVAHIGHHEIYKIEEVQSVYIPCISNTMSPEEQRYAKLFQSVDLTTNFYFCYTYDLSRTLQENALVQRELNHNNKHYSRSIDAETMFIWNNYLLKPFSDNKVTDKWTLEIIHGYVGQQIIELSCSKLSLILIGRRSAEFAGTRFLKRGMNYNGHVANDVETEQIIWDIHSTPSILTGNFTAFVQRRGSIPLFWSQDPTTRGVVGKPPVMVDLVEPNAYTTALHFKNLRRKYGYPISIINLVKRRGGEKTRDEKLLHSQYLKTVRYLNAFMKPGKCLDYISFDVARCNKEGQVLPRLEQIGLKLILKQGWFQSFKPYKVKILMKHPILNNFNLNMSEDGEMLLQSGISRTNCVDCLDRTNVAQFGLGKAALGFQLYAMGYTSEPIMSSTSELCRVYEDLFDEHGDTMALQYAGSQLVHSIKTYKKTSAFQERSRDVIQTLSRYYSNTFNDFERQHGINIFLGLYKPYIRGKPPLWDLTNDRYLHFPIKFNQKINYLEWVDNVHSDSEEDDVWDDWFNKYPKDREIYSTKSFNSKLINSSRSPLPNSDEMYWFNHREWEITNFEMYLKNIAAQTYKKTISILDINQSAFQSISFMKLWKTQEQVVPEGKKRAITPTDEDEDDEDDENRMTADESEEELVFEEDRNPPYLSPRQSISPPIVPKRSISPEIMLNFDNCLKSTEEIFGFKIMEPNMDVYEKYAKIAAMEKRVLNDDGYYKKFSTNTKTQLADAFEFRPSIFTVDSVYETEVLEITKEASRVYDEYVSLNNNFVLKNDNLLKNFGIIH